MSLFTCRVTYLAWCKDQDDGSPKSEEGAGSDHYSPALHPPQWPHHGLLLRGLTGHQVRHEVEGGGVFYELNGMT